MTTKLQRNKDIVASALGRLLSQKGVDELGEGFTGGVNARVPFRNTQREAIEAAEQFVLHDDNGHKGYFEIATGIGKTVIFISLVKGSLFEARKRGIKDFNSVIVVPTRQLVSQTKKSFEDYVPELKGEIGRYGDGHKELDKPITIITYASWRSLVEDGVLNYENTDLLISDEAHRGLSDRQVDNFFSAFGDETISFAFTATSEFDTEKTVERTHGYKIYSKSIADGVRGNELAAYIQTQLHVIGVEAPDLSDEFNEEADKSDEDANYRARLKQEAWNKFALQQFKSGRDDHTGDLLNENKAAFFVADTAHADRLEEILNSDPQLEFIAKSRGLYGVSVAIHSRLPPSEQTKRMKDYLARKYMAVIGDSQFKEGFDYPPLKTIFDYPRGSLVDKSQILGRGGRKWWNEAKGRFEGMTFIDTAIYFKVDDEEASQKNRANALKYAVLASSVIDGTYVLSDAEEKRKRFGSGKQSSPVVRGSPPEYPVDIQVESYASLEEIKSIHAEIARLNKDHWVDLTDEMKEQLRSEMERSGLGPKSLSNIISLRSNITLRPEHLKNWLGHQKTVDAQIFNFVFSYLKTQPTKKSDNLSEITDRERDYLQFQMKRTGFGAKKIAVSILELEDDAIISARKIEKWATVAKKVNKHLFGVIICLLEKQPDTKPTIDLTAKVKSDLRSEMDRVGLGSKLLARELNSIYGQSFITHIDINNWLSVTRRTAEADKLEAAFSFLKNQKSVEIDERETVFLSSEMKGALRREMQRTGLGDVTLARKLNDLYGEGFINRSRIKNWLSDKLFFNVDIVFFNKVIEFLSSQPQANIFYLTEDRKTLLREQIERSGIGYKPLSRELNTRFGEGFISYQIIKGWCTNIKTADEEKFIKVIGYLQSMPSTEKGKRITLSKDILDQITAQKIRTGLGSVAICAALRDQLGEESLDRTSFENWFKGQKTAVDKQVRAVMDFLRSQPDARPEVFKSGYGLPAPK